LDHHEWFLIPGLPVGPWMGLSGSLAECNTHTAGHCLDILSSLLKTGKGYRMLKKVEGRVKIRPWIWRRRRSNDLIPRLLLMTPKYFLTRVLNVKKMSHSNKEICLDLLLKMSNVVTWKLLTLCQKNWLRNINFKWEIIKK
jgi:hypothetical protein